MVMPDLDRCPGCGREYLSASQTKTHLPCGHTSCRRCAIRIHQGLQQCQGCNQVPSRPVYLRHQSHPSTSQVPASPAVSSGSSAELEVSPSGTSASRKSFLPVSVVPEYRGGLGSPWQVIGAPVRQAASRPKQPRPKSHYDAFPATSEHDTLPTNAPPYGTLPAHSKHGTLPTHAPYGTLPAHSKHDTLPTHATTYGTLPAHSKHDTLPTHVPPYSTLPAHSKHGTLPTQVPPHGTLPAHSKHDTLPTHATPYGTLPAHSKHGTLLYHPQVPEGQGGRTQLATKQSFKEAVWKGRQGQDAGQSTVGNLRQHYEQYSGAIPTSHHLPTSKRLPGSPRNSSLLSKRSISKSTGAVNKDTTQPHYSSTRNLANMGQAGSSSSGSREKPSNAHQLPIKPTPGRRATKRHEPVKPKPHLKQRTSRPVEKTRANSSLRTSPPPRAIQQGKAGEREGQEGNGEMAVLPSSFTPSPSKTPENLTQGGWDQDATGHHVARPVYIVSTRDSYLHYDPHDYDYDQHDSGHREAAMGKVVWERQERDLASSREEVKVAVEARARLEEEQRVAKEAMAVLQQEVARQKEEISRLRFEVRQLRARPSLHDVEETKKMEAMKDKLHQEALHREALKREVLQLEVNQLRTRLRSERQRWETERLTRKQENVDLLKQLQDATEELSELRARRTEVPLSVTEADSQGLPNLGNTCYINSIAQCLFSVQHLRIYFKEERHKQELNVESEQGGEVAMAFARVFHVLETGTRPYGTLKDFQVVLGAYDDLFQPGLQQDSHDLLACLLLWLHNDLTIFTPHSVPKKLPQPPQTEGGGSGRTRGGSSSSSVISNLFQGQRESSITCPLTGKLLSCTTETFRTLTLAVTGRDQCSLEGLLGRHCRAQELEWECGECDRPHPCTYVTRLVTLPSILVVHLNRDAGGTTTGAGGGGGKTRVVYPAEGLTLENLLTSDGGGYSPVYDLVSVCNHMGTTSSGHYTAYCRSGGGRWWLWDDTELQAARLDQVLGQPAAYILFYQAAHDSYV